MDFLELWKNYPVLWHQRSPPKDPVYAAAAAELTEQINSLRNLAVTNAGMLCTLSRIRNWFRFYKYNGGKISVEERNIRPEYFENVKPKYYDKLAEFLPMHETRTVRCDKCRNFFLDEEELKEHCIKRHKQYCELCQKEFGTAAKYRKHAFIHEPPKHKCEICGKEYLRMLGLKEHMRAHRNERNFVCDKCGKKFVRQNNLSDHKKLRHPDKHNFVKRQPCAICGIDFKDWSALCVHRRRYHMVREGTIEELALEVMAGVREKRKHTFVFDPVTQQRRTVCEICGNTYARHGGLYVHMVNAHGFVRPGQRLKVARQAQSNFVQIKLETNGGETHIDKMERRNSDEIDVEIITQIEADDDDEDSRNLISEEAEMDEYEFLIEEIDVLDNLES